MLPHCYEDSDSVEPFLQLAKEKVPFLAYIAIRGSYDEKDQMFKVVALTHLRNYYKKGAIAKDVLKELVQMLGTFRDPYQDFYEKGGLRTWTETKDNILGGLSI